MFTITILIQHSMEVPASEIRKVNDIKGIEFEKKKINKMVSICR